MNAIQIYQEVAALTSEGRMASDAVFYASLNRALAEVGRLDPIKAYRTVGHFPPPAVFRLTKPVTVTANSPLTVSADDVAAFALSAFGKGSLAVLCDGQLSEEMTFDEGGKADIRRSVKTLMGGSRAEVTLIFTSTEELDLVSLVLYGRMTAACDEAIPPDERYLCYDMKSADARFLYFTGEIVKDRQELLDARDEVRLENGKVMIDRACRGVYEIGYARASGRVTEENKEDEVDVGNESEHLLPLLTAYYCCLEDGDARAEALFARYEDERRRYEGRRVSSGGSAVEDRYGW